MTLALYTDEADIMILDEHHTKIADYIDGLTNDTQVRLLLTYCIGRLMLKNVKQGKALFHGTGTILEAIHITDWLSAAVINNASWLQNTDEHGRPKKLLKFSNFAQVLQEANKAMLIEAHKSASIRLNEGDEALVAQLEEGFYVVRLQTPEALDKESGQMQHCIGHGAYDRDLAEGRSAFLSLRDQFGKAHATLEVNKESRRIIQLQGKQNAFPNARYIRLLLPFMKDMRLQTSDIEFSGSMIIDNDYVLHDLFHLPDHSVIKGDVNIEGVAGVKFPENLHIIGSLDIVECFDVQMPKNLVVTENIEIRFTDRISAADSIVAGGKLDARDCTGWPHVASKLEVDDLFMKDCDVISLPEEFSVKKDVIIQGCPIPSIGNLKRFEGNLCLVKTNVTELPTGLYVGKTLDISDSMINRLPEGLSGCDSITLTRSAVTELPDNLTLINLDISHTVIEQLPQGLEVLNCLIANDTIFKRWPASTKVGTYLGLARSKVAELPDGMTLDGFLDISNSQLKRLPSNLTVKSLIAHSPYLRRIGKNLTVCGDADFRGSGIRAVPSDATFHGNVILADCDHLRDVGPNKFPENLNLQRSGMTTLPDGLEVGRDLVVSHSALERLPRVIAIGGNLYSKGLDLEVHDQVVIGGTHSSDFAEAPFEPWGRWKP